MGTFISIAKKYKVTKEDIIEQNPEVAKFMYIIGPAYGYTYNNVLLSSSLNFAGAYSNTGKIQKTKMNAQGKEFVYQGIDCKFNWGVALTPKVVVKLGKIMPWLGVNVQWAKGIDKLTCGFQTGE